MPTMAPGPNTPQSTRRPLTSRAMDQPGHEEAEQAEDHGAGVRPADPGDRAVTTVPAAAAGAGRCRGR